MQKENVLVITCKKCGSKKMTVTVRSFSCAGCAHEECMNQDRETKGCTVEGIGPCRFGPGYQYTCAKFESCGSEDASCACGDSNGSGCWLAECSECGAFVDSIPFIEP